ncbi:phosphotransferase [Candidatus Pacearchaeota archaeon]|nr:phosphotransferase [Candidatus Pacearchaeota archaeon]
MKLTKKEAQKIADNYNLGKVGDVKYLSEGWVNWNFKLETKKGDYVVQILGGEFNKRKKEKMKIQFQVLDFLRRKNFPYEIPKPLTNRNKTNLMKFKSKYLWVYPYLKGKTKKKLNKKEFQEIAKVMAIFHKYLRDLKIKTSRDYYDFNWIINKYKILKKRKIKNKLDKLFIENSDFLLSILEKLEKLNYEKMILTHSDFKSSNLLFRKGKIKGILDFDNLEYAPKTKDVASSLTKAAYLGKNWNFLKQKIFLQEYKKFNSFSKKEEPLIMPVLLKDRICVFWWFYDEMKKNKDKAYNSMIKILNEINELLKEWKK